MSLKFYFLSILAFAGFMSQLSAQDKVLSVRVAAGYFAQLDQHKDYFDPEDPTYNGVMVATKEGTKLNSGFTASLGGHFTIWKSFGIESMLRYTYFVNNSYFEANPNAPLRNPPVIYDHRQRKRQNIDVMLYGMYTWGEFRLRVGSPVYRKWYYESVGYLNEEFVDEIQLNSSEFRLALNVSVGYTISENFGLDFNYESYDSNNLSIILWYHL